MDQAPSAAVRLAAVLAKTPKAPDHVVFVGRAGGLFIDNGKYAFLHAVRHAPHLRCAFMTFDAGQAKLLRAKGLDAFCFDDPDGPSRLARAAIVVSDDMSWKTRTLAPLFTQGAFLVQLWHGIPLKAIGFPEIQSAVNMNPEKARDLTVGYSGYDAVLSTSPFFREKAFARAFRAKAFWDLGYPRNDALQRAPDKLDMINVDQTLYVELVRAKKQGLKIVFYMPTFRDLGGDPWGDGAFDYPLFADFARARGVLLVCKFHPYIRLDFTGQIEHLRFCPPESDAYPLLRLADLLMTDYSSIYFDFLLTDKPMLFFPYDFEAYVTRNRELLFDYDAFTPGPKAHDTKSLLAAMADLLDGKDDFIQARQKLKELSFAEPDARAGQRLLGALTEVSTALGRSPDVNPNNERFP
ncbi:CDP-glycerol glycerophosphotransferase family protein [Solidesulfovibrio magneticus]|uniref:CDP-glycerol glycerophosphotransferase n=1 Tax=Solidesulfovibrio magneticus (strain ATCC 700980 / DSM 13731 / RS-1) TaxID=573370 RepID=C4XUM4_SOLM1|nr:CDP-glycerol glycerophosphotransferase family protein [Solidesulfovibrio magneticus]BAH73475.1 putative CDP-glycerol glycerophosphotransferase [Solidesulfovibrio magneticus RS-1]